MQYKYVKVIKIDVPARVLIHQSRTNMAIVKACIH